MITAQELLKSAGSLGKKNYEYNSKLRKPLTLINGQRSCAVSNHKLGIRKMSGNGCAAIAVFNALLHAGHKPDFCTISLGLDTYALRMKGIFGTDPEKMDTFFEKCRIAAVKAADYTDFVNVMKAVNAGILCYWVAKPKKSLLHFVAVINNHDGTYSVCNRFSNRKKPSVTDSIEKVCPKECFVCGYFIN